MTQIRVRRAEASSRASNPRASFDALGCTPINETRRDLPRSPDAGSPLSSALPNPFFRVQPGRIIIYASSSTEQVTPPLQPTREDRSGATQFRKNDPPLPRLMDRRFFPSRPARSITRSSTTTDRTGRLEEPDGPWWGRR